MPNMVFPPDNVWVNYPLPWVEGRCIPEKRLMHDGERWIVEWRYPAPDEEGEDEKPDYEPELLEIVRCKDCKWRNTGACFCKAPEDVEDDWFCSEGDKR